MREANMALLNPMGPGMNSKAVVSAIVAMSLPTGGFAFAQGNGDRNDRGRNEQAQRGGQQDRRDNEARQPDGFKQAPTLFWLRLPPASSCSFC